VHLARLFAGRRRRLAVARGDRRRFSGCRRRAAGRALHLPSPPSRTATPPARCPSRGRTTRHTHDRGPRDTDDPAHARPDPWVHHDPDRLRAEPGHRVGGAALGLADLSRAGRRRLPGDHQGVQPRPRGDRRDLRSPRGDGGTDEALAGASKRGGGYAYVAATVYERLRQAYEESARKRLDRLRRKAVAAGVRASALLRDSASAPEEIVRVARAKRIDIIVMGTHGRGGIAKMFLGSVAERVVRTATRPVLTVRGR